MTDIKRRADTGSRGIGRRTALVGIGTVGSALIGGCLEERTYSLSEHVGYTGKVNSRLAQGDSVGVRYGDEQWRVGVQAIHDDDSIDISVEKVMLDETGQIDILLRVNTEEDVKTPSGVRRTFPCAHEVSKEWQLAQTHNTPE